MQLTSKKTIESTAIPGVKFTVRRLNKVQRARRDSQIGDARSRYSDACFAYIETMQSGGYSMLEDKTWKKEADTPDTPEFLSRVRALGQETTLLFTEHLVPASLRAGLISIEGLANGETLITTADGLLDCGADADDLIDEIYLACEDGAGLSENERKNSPSPSTTEEPVAGATSDSTATTASA